MLKIREYQEVFNDLQKDGFAKIGCVNNSLKLELKLFSKYANQLLTSDEVIEQNQYIKDPENYYEPPVRSQIGKVSTNILGRELFVDNFFKSIFNIDLINIIHEVGGKNCKITTSHIRYVDQTTNSDNLHEDGVGQISLSLLLNDICPEMSTTVFVKGSHRFPLRIKDKLERIPISIFRSIFTPSFGKQGDLFIFLNKAWHGMKASDVIQPSSVVLFTFDTEGYYHTVKNNIPKVTEYGDNFEKAIGTGLFEMLNEDKMLADNRAGMNDRLLIEKGDKETVVQDLDNNYLYNLRTLSYSSVAFCLILIVRIIKTVFHILRNAKKSYKGFATQK